MKLGKAEAIQFARRVKDAKIRNTVWSDKTKYFMPYDNTVHIKGHYEGDELIIDCYYLEGQIYTSTEFTLNWATVDISNGFEFDGKGRWELFLDGEDNL